MANNLAQTGVIQVDGAWATSVKYAAAALGPDVGTVELRFMQGRAEVARAVIARANLSDLLGEENRGAIERHMANDADKYLAVVSGELRGPRLHYQKVSLAKTEPLPVENSIESTPLRTPIAAEHEKDEKQRRRTGNAHVAEANAARATVPAHIAAKYLIKDNAYHFDDQTVAFVDKGTSLTVHTHNKAIIQDLVAIAEARNWQAVTVSGTKEFRREAWAAAAAAGLTVSGYTPTGIERAAAERARARRDAADSAEATPRDSRPRAPANRPQRGVRYGTLIAHGEAPYRHDTTQSPSYFVTLRDAAGRERTFWGVGLKEAIRESNTAPEVNDLVGLRRSGSTPVSVVSRSYDEGGGITTQTVDAKRHRWEVEKAEYFGRSTTSPENQSPPSSTSETATVSATKDGPSLRLGATSLTRDQEAAAAIRSAATTREELQLKYPELNRAVFQHLASHDQFADAYVKSGLIRESDRAQVITQMRERLAGRLERGTVIREPDNKEVNTLIRRSVNRVAADIGRPPLDQPRTSEVAARASITREDVQVRA